MTSKANSFQQHPSQTAAKHNSHDGWAPTYDEEVKSVNYQAPDLLAETAIYFQSSGIYLDVGCGTGLVAEAIADRGSLDITIDGCDISAQMLAIAERKNVYRSLTCCNIFDLPYEPGSYDVAIAAGVFASREDRRQGGNADAEALAGVVELVKPNGYCIFSVSHRVWQTDREQYEQAIAQLPVQLMQKNEQPYHDANPTMFNIVLQKNPL